MALTSDHLPTRYERVTVQQGDATKHLFLREPCRAVFCGVACVSGLEVNREGVAVAHGKVDETRHMIAASLIAKRIPYRMSKKYGTLEGVAP